MKNFVVEPRSIAKLESGAHVRQFAKKRAQHVRIFFKGGRQLKQDRAEAVAELARNFQKVLQHICAIAQLRPMRDFLWGFQGKPEIFRRKRPPVLDCLERWDAMKCVIDSRRRKSLGKKRQHFRSGQILGIKFSLPLGALKTSGAHRESHTKPSNAEHACARLRITRRSIFNPEPGFSLTSLSGHKCRSEEHTY